MKIVSIAMATLMMMIGANAMAADADNEIQIRQATMEEIPALNMLIAHSARELSTDVYTETQIESAIQHVFGVDSGLVADGTYFVILKGGIIAGCGGWSKRNTLFGGDNYAGREEVSYLNPEKDSGKIRAFFIHPDFARKGLGKRLLRHCEQEALKEGFKRLEMMATLPGVKLYLAANYQALSDNFLELLDGTKLKLIQMAKELK